tara:strand:+ start:1212 stop:1436 length:225 start_codon:yes stop_codon:yes gene_type:complete
MNPQVIELIQSFETDSKTNRQKYSDFLGHVYKTFDSYISNCKSDRVADKYKKMRNGVLSYIVAHEKSIISKLSK